jgi:GT2 family glycosyltransferase
MTSPMAEDPKRSLDPDLQQGAGSACGVSVVIPTINRSGVLLDTVRDILAQEFDDWELIIVDQSDTVDHALLALLGTSPTPARYFKARFRGLPQARNFGWRLASKGIVLFVDDDIRCDPSFVRAHHDAHRRSGATLVAGGIVEPNDDPARRGATGAFNWWTASCTANFHLTTPGSCVHAKGCNFSVRRTDLARAGGFDEALSVGAALYEEAELALRLLPEHGPAWFAPEARLTHLVAPSGGCRVPNDVVRYMHGFAHNRSILIFRHLRWWHYPTALARLFLFGLSYSRADRSLRPLLATLRGIPAGRRAAMAGPLNAPLEAEEWTPGDPKTAGPRAIGTVAC